MNHARQPEVMVVGGGLLGWSAAHRIAKGGRRVAVVDRADAGHATQAGAGIICPGASLNAAAGFEAIGRAAVDYYHKLIPELAKDGAPETGYDTVGILFVGRDDGEWERLPEAMRTMARRRDAGMGNLGRLEPIDGAAARELFPPLADLPGAIWIPEAARVDGRLLRDALRQAAIRHGAVAIAGDARLVREVDRVAKVVVGAETFAPEIVVIAGGAWSNALGEAIGVTIPVHPQRGQIIHLDLPGVETGRWPIVEGFSPQYLLTFPGSRVVAGATREHDSGYDVRMTAGGVHSVLTEALRVAPGLAAGTVAEIRIGLRPFSPDGLPFVGNAPGLSNVYLNTGHGPSGLQLGPVSGAAVAALIDGETPPFDLAAVDPARWVTA